MVYAFYRITYTSLVMRPIYKLIVISIICLYSYNVSAQPGKIKQPPKISVVKVPNVNVKVHANSNSVFGTGNTHPNYNKKTPPKKGEIKSEGDKEKNKEKKKKK